MEPNEKGKDILDITIPHCQWPPTHDKTHMPLTKTKKLFRLLNWSGVILSNLVTLSRTPPVSFWYSSKALVGIKTPVVPTICHWLIANQHNSFSHHHYYAPVSTISVVVDWIDVSPWDMDASIPQTELVGPVLVIGLCNLNIYSKTIAVCLHEGNELGKINSTWNFFRIQV